MPPTCGQDQLVFFHGQATEAGFSGARVLAQGQERRDILVLQNTGLALTDCNVPGPWAPEARDLMMQGAAPPGGQESAFLAASSQVTPTVGGRWHLEGLPSAQALPFGSSICGAAEHIFPVWKTMLHAF